MEQAYEVVGAGFIPGVPGEFATCRVIVEDGQVLRIEPLGAGDVVPLPEQLVQPAEQEQPLQPVKEQSSIEQEG